MLLRNSDGNSITSVLLIISGHGGSDAGCGVAPKRGRDPKWRRLRDSQRQKRGVFTDHLQRH